MNARALIGAQLVGNVLFGADDIVKPLVAANLPHIGPAGFGPSVSLGVVKNGKIVGGVIFNDYTGFSLGIAAWISHPTWATRDTMRTLFSYPFLQVGVVRLEALIARKNKRARKMTRHMGFVEEGCHPLRYDGIEDAISYGMLREQCPWIKDAT